MSAVHSAITIRRWLAFAAVVGALTLGLRQGICADGEGLFLKHCAACHGKDGKAQTPVARKLGVKDLSQSKLTDAEVEKQVVEGRRDERGNQKMPSFKGRLSPEELKSLIAAVKAFRK